MVMVTKWLKMIVVVVVVLGIIGALLFGKDIVSYLRSSAKSVQDAVKSNVPTEFELRRARDLLEEIIPEMHANIRLIAQEEVEIAALKSDIERSAVAGMEERRHLERISSALGDRRLANCTIGGSRCDRDQLKEELAQRFNRFKEAEIVLASKRRLLTARERSLQSALALLERTRSQKILLAQKIETLESQNRLIKAAAVGSAIEFDNSKLTQTERLIGQIKKRLDVAERVLAHESRFVQPVAIDETSEEDLLAEVREYLQGPAEDQTASTEKENQLVSRAEASKALPASSVK
jgi:hypothetical protein